jgi:hypothetical protein
MPPGRGTPRRLADSPSLVAAMAALIFPRGLAGHRRFAADAPCRPSAPVWVRRLCAALACVLALQGLAAALAPLQGRWHRHAPAAPAALAADLAALAAALVGHWIAHVQGHAHAHAAGRDHGHGHDQAHGHPIGHPTVAGHADDHAHPDGTAARHVHDAGDVSVLPAADDEGARLAALAAAPGAPPPGHVAVPLRSDGHVRNAAPCWSVLDHDARPQRKPPRRG